MDLVTSRTLLAIPHRGIVGTIKKNLSTTVLAGTSAIAVIGALKCGYFKTALTLTVASGLALTDLYTSKTRAEIDEDRRVHNVVHAHLNTTSEKEIAQLKEENRELRSQVESFTAQADTIQRGTEEQQELLRKIAEKADELKISPMALLEGLESMRLEYHRTASAKESEASRIAAVQKEKDSTITRLQMLHKILADKEG